MVAVFELGRALANRDEDFLPQLLSWAIAVAFGVAWILVVYLTPLPLAPVIHQPPEVSPILSYEPGTAPPAALPPNRVDHGNAASHSPAQARTSPVKLAEIFALALADHAGAQITRLIPGATSVQADVGGAHPAGGKAAIASDGANETPGMSGFSGSTGRGMSREVGKVSGGTPIARADFKVRPLPLVTAPTPGTTLADATEMGSFVRSRVAQLQACYERSGGTDLAGVVALRLTVGDAGMVKSAEIVRRTWSGPAAAATEQCLLGIVRGWRMPFASSGATVTLPISFTRGT